MTLSLESKPPFRAPIYVISLASSLARRTSMTAQAALHGLHFTFFDAINGYEPHSLFDRVDTSQRLTLKGKPFRPGEVGCWASHYLLWERCVASGVPLIILEDDIRIHRLLRTVLDTLSALPNDVEYFRLHSAEKPSSAWARFGHLSIHRYWRSPMCTYGYYLAPSAAAKFLAHAPTWAMPVDDYMDLSWVHGVLCLGLKPGAVSQGDFTSTIRPSDRNRASGAWASSLTREAFRGWRGLRRHLFDLPSRVRSTLSDL